jgi:ABC-2 type transport system ATP-binding protein
MLELIRDLGHNKGINLILSSHLLPDVEYTCDHVIVMDKGAVVAQGPIEELKGPRGRVFEVRIKGDTAVFLQAVAEAGFEAKAADEDVMRVFVPADVSPQALFAIAARHQLQVRHLRPSVPTLEDVFARAVGEPADA